MILDDRPVIEQLLNPTPLNILEEVRAEMAQRGDSEEVDAGKQILRTLRDAIKELNLDLSTDTLDQLDIALEHASDEIAEWVVDVAEDLMSELYSVLEDRL